MSTSSLLYAALSNRLAASSLNGAQQQQNPGAHSEQQLSEWESISHASDDELVDVASLPGTAPGTPRNASRPSSPPPALRVDGSPTKAASRSRAAAKIKSKTDPLRALPSEYSQAFDPIEHVDSFLLIPPPGPAAAAGSSSSSNGTDSAATGAASSGPAGSTGSAAATWTRRESRTDWKLTFAKQVRMARRELERGDALFGVGGGSGSSGYATPSRTERLASEGVITNTERRQQQWAEAAQLAQTTTYSKTERREHYKSQGSRGGKVKGKTGKGGVKTGQESLWD
ncbi:hypothetical protein OC834_001815 [Tilletia horrida]|nr:hypothetical protein OC834_001815 [Tilletia horrida]